MRYELEDFDCKDASNWEKGVKGRMTTSEAAFNQQKAAFEQWQRLQGWSPEIILELSRADSEDELD